MSALALRRGDAMTWALGALVALAPSAAAASLSNPANSIPPSPDFTSTCSGTQYDNSMACVNLVLQAIASARAMEQVGPMVLPSNWYTLSPIEQLYVGTTLEMVDRGLPSMDLATALDQDAQGAAVADGDPSSVPSSVPWTAWGGNWAGGDGNPLAAIYYWMYDDGLNSGNVDCTQQDQSGCWGHRDNILGTYSCPCFMGTGFAYDFSPNLPDWTEILVASSGTQPLDLAWSQVTPYLTGGSMGTAGSTTGSITLFTTATAASSSGSSSATMGTTGGTTGGSTAAATTATGAGTTAAGTTGSETTGTGSTQGAGSTGGTQGTNGLGADFGTTTASSSSAAPSGGCSSTGGASGLLTLVGLLGLSARRRRIGPP